MEHPQDVRFVEPDVIVDEEIDKQEGHGNLTTILSEYPEKEKLKNVSLGGFGPNKIHGGEFCQALKPRETSERFAEQEAPEGPWEEWFVYASTTLWLENVKAAELANMMLDFIDLEGLGTIAKMSHKKLAFKVQVCINSMWCGVKIRLYQKGSKHALEIHHRSGDAYVFNTFYKRALDFLTKKRISFIGK